MGPALDPAPYVDTEEMISKGITKPTRFPVEEKKKYPSSSISGPRPWWTYRKAWRNIMRADKQPYPWTEGPVTDKLVYPAYRPNARHREVTETNAS